MLTNEIKDLSYSEKLLLFNDLWDELATVPERIQLSRDQKVTLDERYDAFIKTPERGSSWQDVKGRILKMI